MPKKQKDVKSNYSPPGEHPCPLDVRLAKMVLRE